MSSETPETFEDVVKAQIRDVLLKSGQYHNISYMEPDLGAWRLQMEAIVAAHTTALEAAKREARLDAQIDLLDELFKRASELPNGTHDKYGWDSHAFITVAMAKQRKLLGLPTVEEERRAQLSQPNQPKENQDA